MATIYFQQIDAPIRAQDAIATVYRQPTKDSVDLLKKINNLTGKEFMYPGDLLCVPSSHGIPEHSIPTIQESSLVLSHSSRHAHWAPAAQQFNNNFEKYLYAQKEDIGIDVLKNFSEGRSTLVETVVSQITDDLRQLNTLLLNSASRSSGVPYNAPKFSAFDAQKAQIFQRLQNSMRILPKGFEVMKANAVSAQDALGISNNAVKRAFRTSGASVEVKQIRETIARADEAARITKNGAKYLGISLQVAMGAKTIYDHLAPGGAVQTEQRANPQSSDIIGLNAAGRDIGGTAGSFLGGYLGGLAGAGVATLLLSNPVGWTGLAVVGIAAIAGGATLGFAGNEGGGFVAGKIMRAIDPSRTAEINMIVSPKE
ncbi:hypothetical protein [Bradyrhizobium jicamae]|uniref:hypothetical protein n=1 Tax=Bradyrhizobium jicamae TaxID=280332 RepID=UPI001BAC7B3E|nr:hypothetical protein [Bradyrhizobium jicamae]MBR0939520.1 hypothetical protein [Bradyrhizobium jicamae]